MPSNEHLQDINEGFSGENIAPDHSSANPPDTSLRNSPRLIVQDFLHALNAEDFDRAGKWLRDDLLFKGVLGSREGADAYMDDMRKMKLKYQVLKVFENGMDVCVLANINMADRKTIFTSLWYTLKSDKIYRIRVVFDPRPVLESQNG